MYSPFLWSKLYWQHNESYKIQDQRSCYFMKAFREENNAIYTQRRSSTDIPLTSVFVICFFFFRYLFSHLLVSYAKQICFSCAFSACFFYPLYIERHKKDVRPHCMLIFQHVDVRKFWEVYGPTNLFQHNFYFLLFYLNFRWEQLLIFFINYKRKRLGKDLCAKHTSVKTKINDLKVFSLLQ